MKYGQSEKTLSYSNACNKKRATCFATLLQNELYKSISDVERFTADVRTCLTTISLQGFFRGW